MHKPPPRIVDDPRLSSALRSDMERAGEEDQAYAATYDAAGKAAAFQAALAAGTLAATGVSIGGNAWLTGAGQKTLGGWVVKAALGILGASALMLAGAGLHAGWQARNRPSEPRSTVTAPVAPAPAPPVAPAPSSSPRSVSAPTPAPVIAPSSLHAGDVPRVRRSAGRGPQEEVRQLARIRTYLRAGDAAKALRLAERGHLTRGDSPLWQEREALAVLALLELERGAEAQQRASALLERFPDSPFRAELEQRARRTYEP